MLADAQAYCPGARVYGTSCWKACIPLYVNTEVMLRHVRLTSCLLAETPGHDVILVLSRTANTYTLLAHGVKLDILS